MQPCVPWVNVLCTTMRRLANVITLRVSALAPTPPNRLPFTARILRLSLSYGTGTSHSLASQVERASTSCSCMATRW
jgi:hypothetical protein